MKSLDPKPGEVVRLFYCKNKSLQVAELAISYGNQNDRFPLDVFINSI